jgi:hypothetical protein
MCKLTKGELKPLNPARICDLCDEAYISPETSRLVDRVMDKYRAGRLEVKPITAGEIDLKQSA